MQIARSDIIWNYAATFLKIGTSALLLPFILKMMPAETVGIWTIFMTITSFAGLLDFGFNPSFSRNITYVFSGVRILKVNGFSTADKKDNAVDYGLLKGVINVMRWFYLRVALILFILLITLGTYYIYTVLKSYNGSHSEVYISWILLCAISTYNLYTLYYESLLQGKGLIKRSKQILVAGQCVYFIIASTLILAGYGLVAIVSAQTSSVIIVRLLSYRSFFTNELKEKLSVAIPRRQKEILQAIYPNAMKVGLTSLGGFMVSRSAIVVGSLYLNLENIAAYGITMQLIAVIAAMASIYAGTYQPQIAYLRIENNRSAIKEIYLTSQVVLLATFLAGGICLVIFGESSLRFVGSQTQLMPQLMIVLALIVAFLECNHSIAGGILLSKNEVPFFKAALLSGGSTVLLIFIFLNFFSLGLWALVLAPGIAQGAYQNWKWPLVVAKELQITATDVKMAMKYFIMRQLCSSLSMKLS